MVLVSQSRREWGWRNHSERVEGTNGHLVPVEEQTIDRTDGNRKGPNLKNHKDLFSTSSRVWILV